MKKLNKVFELLNKVNAKEITTVDFENKSPFYDYFIIATATNVQSTSFLNYLKAEKKEFRSEGARSGWVLVDLGDVIVHLFTNDERERINLDNHLLAYRRVSEYTTTE